VTIDGFGFGDAIFSELNLVKVVYFVYGPSFSNVGSWISSAGAAKSVIGGQDRPGSDSIGAFTQLVYYQNSKGI
jgi:hypothetical protein